MEGEEERRMKEVREEEEERFNTLWL